MTLIEGLDMNVLYTQGRLRVIEKDEVIRVQYRSNFTTSEGVSGYGDWQNSNDRWDWETAINLMFAGHPEIQVWKPSSSIYREIADERNDQDRIWGGEEYDDQHSWRDWNLLIERYLRKYVDASRELSTYYRGLSRKALIQTAALCVAAIESLDRKCKA